MIVELLIGSLMEMGPSIGMVPSTSERNDEKRRSTLDELAYISSVVKGLVEDLKERDPSIETRVSETGVRLPKIEMPTFDGNVLG